MPATTVTLRGDPTLHLAELRDPSHSCTLMHMTTQDWPRFRDEVVIITSEPGTRYPTASRATVARLTPTTIVLDSDRVRFRRDDLRGKGEVTYGATRHLARPDSREALEIFARQARNNGLRRATRLLEQWRASDDLRGEDILIEVRALLTAIEVKVADLLNQIDEGVKTDG